MSRLGGALRLLARVSRSYSRAYSTRKTVAGIELPTLEDLYLKQGDNVVVAMSGGVDSSVTLQLLRELDLNLTVLFMRNWDPLLSEEGAAPTQTSLSYGNHTPAGTPNLSPCEWERDWADVRRVCAHVGVPEVDIRFVDLSKEYWSRVFEPAVAVWEAGQTPNPDVACNREIKFGALMEYIPQGHYLATGHYAKVVRTPGGAHLHRAVDNTKDQTYYLSQVEEGQLRKAVFPLAGIPKRNVRDLARHYALPTAERQESMGVCFIGERGHFGDFVSQYVSPPLEGWLVDSEGTRLQKHRGSCYYTIGQRAGLQSQRGRWYIARKGVGENGQDMLAVPGADHPALHCAELWSNDFNWIAGRAPEMEGGLEMLIQIRHCQRPIVGEVRLEGDLVRVTFPTPVHSVAPGQIVGVWRGDECLGSGVIEGTRCLDQ